jgi:hypothetical protein
MAGLLRTVVVFLALACAPALAQQTQQTDANLQALLNALMSGTPVTLLSPLRDGTVEVTSLTVPGQRSAAEAALLLERARIDLSNLGVDRPTGQQLSRALAGGTIDVPSGRTQLGGALPQGTPGVALRSQVINAANLPTAVGVSPSGVTPGQAAAGGTANPPNGGLAGQMAAPQTQQSPIVTPLPPSTTAVPPLAPPTPLLR